MKDAGWTPARQAIYSHMRVADTKGGDVRLSPFLLYRPHAWPRVSVEMNQWVWNTIQAYPWESEQHINMLELWTVLNYLRYRARSREAGDCRFLLISDSQVVCAVAAKGRSSSLKLNNILRRVAAISIARGIRTYFHHLVSV